MAVGMPPILNPIAIGQIVARNLVPIVGVIAFGWSAVNVLLLYFVDTMLSMGVMFAGLASFFSRQSSEDGRRGAHQRRGRRDRRCRVPVPVHRGAARHAAGGSSARCRAGKASPRCGRTSRSSPGSRGKSWAAIWSYWALWQELRHRTPEEVRLKRRFALVMLRWFVIIVAVYLPIGFLFGRFLPFVLVVLYAGTTIFVEIAPDRFLRMMPGGAEDADPLPGSTPPTAAQAAETVQPDEALARGRK
jgi:hypothetical protein